MRLKDVFHCLVQRGFVPFGFSFGRSITGRLILLSAILYSRPNMLFLVASVQKLFQEPVFAFFTCILYIFRFSEYISL